MPLKQWIANRNEFDGTTELSLRSGTLKLLLGVADRDTANLTDEELGLLSARFIFVDAGDGPAAQVRRQVYVDENGETYVKVSGQFFEQPLSVESSSNPANDPPGAVIRSASPFVTGRFRLRDHWAAGDFGAKFEGDDETEELQEAFHECQTNGRRLHLPEGVTGASAALITDLATSAYTKGAGKLTIIEHNIVAGPVLSLAGTISGVMTTMGSGALAGATQITIGSTAGILKGDILWLRDPDSAIAGEDVSGGSGNITVAVAGEVGRVRSVDSATTLTLYGRLCWGYGVNSDVRLLTAPTCEFSDFTIRNVSNTGDTAAARGILLNFCQEARISRVATEKMAGASVYMTGVAGYRVTECDFYDGQDTETSNNPYGIVAARGTVHGIVYGCTQRYGRHLFTTAATATDIPAQHHRIAHCVATGMTQAAFDSHPGARWVTFSDCDAVQCTSHGFQHRAPDCGVIDCNVTGAQSGVFLANGADRAKISGGRFRQLDYGIRVRNSDELTVNGGLTIDAPAIAGIWYEAPAVAWAGHMVSADIDDVRINGTPSTAGIQFSAGAWAPGFRVGPGVRIPDAAAKITGMTTPDLTAAATITVPA